MKVPRTSRRVQYILSRDRITSFAGLKLIADLATRLGILEGLERCTVKKRRRGVPAPDFVMSLAYNFLVGGSHLSDLEELRGEPTTREHLYDLAVAAPTTAGEYLGKFTTGHIKQIESVIGEALRTGAEIAGGDEAITLDLDSSIFPVYGRLKEGARYGYSKDKESAACWEAFLEDMKRRGLKDPLLAAIDGNAGVRKAVRQKFCGALVQRCQVHKMRNILAKLPHLARPTLKKLIYKAFTAATYEQGLAQARAVIAEYRDAFPAAMRCLEQDLQESLTALKFPFLHRRHIRSTNLLERLFGEGKRRTKVIPRFTSEASGLALVFAVLVDTSEGWRGVRIKPYIEERLRQMTVDPDSEWEDPDLKKLAA